MEAIISCVLGMALAMFGTHTYDQAHMKPKIEQSREQNKPDNINIYVGEANHYSLLKNEEGTKVWVPNS